jgi:hypothetical protein
MCMPSVSAYSYTTYADVFLCIGSNLYVLSCIFTVHSAPYDQLRVVLQILHLTLGAGIAQSL